MRQSAILLVVAIVLFFIGRFTAPVKQVEDRRVIDSLMNDLTDAIKDRDKAVDSMKHYRIQSDTWFAEYEKERATRSVIHTTYDNRKKAIDIMPDSILFREFVSVYPDK